jgi:trans-2,3-dihydro-3-hydroxyanthranilate isomerase
VAHRFHIVDVFAESLYAGNTLAVVRDAADLDTQAMQAIAREFGFSETTFVVSDPRDALGAGVAVRIFTPTFELPFAGHPTLGTAWVLREHLLAGRPAAVTLALGVGSVPVAFEPSDGSELAFLTAPPVALGARIPGETVARVLGLAPSDLDPALPVQRAKAGPGFAIVPLRGRAALARVRFDVGAYLELAKEDASTGIYVFAREAERPGNDVRARMFFESAGPREDPATGSATACFGAYLLEHGVYGDSLRLRIEQGVEMGRPSLLHLEASRVSGAPRIRVGGRVIESARGELL